MRLDDDPVVDEVDVAAARMAASLRMTCLVFRSFWLAAPTGIMCEPSLSTPKCLETKAGEFSHCYHFYAVKRNFLQTIDANYVPFSSHQIITKYLQHAGI